MGTLYLVRHGQASFGTDDYDRLSPLGQRQSERLGEHFSAHGIHFEMVLTGTLRRQQQTWAGIAQGMQSHTQALQWPGLNEYDSQALIQALGAHANPLDLGTAEGYRQHFRLLRQALRAWMIGDLETPGIPSFADFAAGAQAALTHVQQHCRGDALIISSGGPIATVLGLWLGSPPEKVVELNLRLRNTAVSELQFSLRRQTLISINTLPHLASPELADWITYA
jgi:broad specificity phosphatase PhoE